MANPKFMKPLQPDADLSAVVGSTPIPRTEVIKNIGSIYKGNHLSNPKVSALTGHEITVISKEKVFKNRHSV